MNYASYETAIVAKHGVKLAGWPLTAPWAKVCNPGDITRIDALRTLHTALLEKTCYWVNVEEAERDAIQPVEKPARADKGVARGSYKKRSLAIRDENDDENDGEGAGTSATQPAKKAKTSGAGSQNAVTKSKSTTAAKPKATAAKPKAAAAKPKAAVAKSKTIAAAQGKAAAAPGKAVNTT